jgi:ketosteroid isomerase-like protein
VSQETINVVQSFFDALSQSDIAAAGAALDPQIEWIEPGVPGQWFTGTRHGSDAVFTELSNRPSTRSRTSACKSTSTSARVKYVVALGQFRGRGKRS